MRNLTKFRCYCLTDMGEELPALNHHDDDGDWYDAEEVDQRIAKLEALARNYKESMEGAQLDADGLKERITELEADLYAQSLAKHQAFETIRAWEAKNIKAGEAIDHWHDVAEGWKARAETAEALLEEK